MIFFFIAINHEQRLLKTSLLPVPDVHIWWLLKADENISECSQVSLEPVQMDYARTSCERHTCDRCPKQDSQRIFYCSIGSDARIFRGVSAALGNGGPRKKLLAGIRSYPYFCLKSSFRCFGYSDDRDSKKTPHACPSISPVFPEHLCSFFFINTFSRTDETCR